MSCARAKRPRRFWRLAAALLALALIGYGAIKTRQVLAAFAVWEGQQIGAAPGAAKR